MLSREKCSSVRILEGLGESKAAENLRERGECVGKCGKANFFWEGKQEKRKKAVSVKNED